MHQIQFLIPISGINIYESPPLKPLGQVLLLYNRISVECYVGWSGHWFGTLFFFVSLCQLVVFRIPLVSLSLLTFSSPVEYAFVAFIIILAIFFLIFTFLLYLSFCLFCFHFCLRFYFQFRFWSSIPSLFLILVITWFDIC